MRWADALFPQWVRRTSVKFDREEFRCMDSVIEKMLVSFGTDAGDGGHCSRRSMFRRYGSSDTISGEYGGRHFDAAK